MADESQFTPALPAPESDPQAPAVALEEARQMEELISVVLDSAEVSTRSAAVAADISGVMRDVVLKIQDNNRRNVLHSRIMLSAFIACLVIAMGVFFGVTLKMAGSIKALDTVVYAMTKRVIEVDASMIAISKTHADFSELTQQQADLAISQGRLAGRLEELGRTVSGLPMTMAEQSNKLSEPRFASVQRDLQGMTGKVQALEARLQIIDTGFQALDGKLQSVAQTLVKQQSMAQDLQKLRLDTEASNLKTQHLVDKVLAKSDAQMLSASKATPPAQLAAKAPPQKPTTPKTASDKIATDKEATEKTASKKSEDDLSAVDHSRVPQTPPVVTQSATAQLQYPRYPRVPEAPSHP